MSRAKSPQLVVIAVLCLLSLLGAGCASKGSAPTGKKGDFAVPVSVATVAQKDVPVEIQVIGNVEAHSTIAVKPQVSGQLTKVYFTEGDTVKAGDLLFEIDRRPLEAQLNQAEANIARDLAQEGQAEAALARDLAQEKYAQAQAARYAKLFAEGIISRDQVEQIRTSADAIAAAANADRAAIQSARAATVAARAMVENAKVQLSYTTIRSPIDGRTGNLAVKQGNIVTANLTDLTTIHQVQPIYATFSVPESQLAAIKRYMALGKLPVMATTQDEGATLETGVLSFIDNAVDASTGTIKLKATFSNAERKLWPGQFVRVVLRLTTQQAAVVVPNQAVQTGQEGLFVYVVKPDRTVESRTVTTGARMDQELVVEQGLQPGETIVTDGHLRLAPGSRVQVRDGRPGGPKAGKRKKEG
ncbi:MAG: efflux RND transporter periplasmic adaptor subunit [Candidatus Solibacter usitatus]|nr:efflux RND transporter periplasmic adaptor subunit [Candidatus Solibacter usitatus]